MFVSASKLAAIVILGVGTASALPSQQTEARGILPSVYYCKNKNFRGSCLESGVFGGSCSAVEASFVGTVSSFRMDAGLKCTIYLDKLCNDGAVTLTSTYVDNLSDPLIAMDDKVSSFKCV